MEGGRKKENRVWRGCYFRVKELDSYLNVITIGLRICWLCLWAVGCGYVKNGVHS